MAEVWLRNNSRAMMLGMIPPVVVVLVGLLLATRGFGLWQSHWWLLAGVPLLAVGLLALSILARQMRRPRLAYDEGHLLVYLTTGQPHRVPLAIVECFLLGRGPSFLPGRKHEETETHTVVVRLDEDAEEWSHRDVKPALGSWCDGHIIIRGTWCEPLDVDRVRALNAQLAQAQRALRGGGVKS